MKVEMVLQPGQAPAPPTLSQRVAPAAKAPAAAAPKKAAAKPVVAKKRQALRRKAPKKSKPAPVTAADLDAQMEDYTAAGVSATAPAS
ncbi:hypothetical protein FRB99_004307 [Tulasnella sp. 403]|nr:hypothetical protein FRB99_004307 [Tulasnella sp. 403]